MAEEHRSAGRVAYVPNLYEGYHIFGLEWNEDEYIFFVDGIETCEQMLVGYRRFCIS